MSYYKLKANLETLPPSVVKNYILSEDLKHLVIYNPNFFVLINLQSKGIVLSNECNEQVRITYCALDQDVFIVQYQMGTKYTIHIRGLRSTLYCHEIETDQEISCHTKTDFTLIEGRRVFGLFFGTTSGCVKFFNFEIQNQLVQLDLKDEQRAISKIKKILLYPEPNMRLLVVVEVSGLVSFYSFDDDFNCNLTNSYLANKDKQWLIDCFRVSRDQEEPRLALVLKTDNSISLFIAEPSMFIENVENNNPSFIRTVLGNFSPYVKCVLLKDKHEQGEYKIPEGDVLALVDEGAREFVDFRFYFLNTGEERECRYTPAEKIKNAIGALFINTSGLLILSHKIMNYSSNRKKINVCIVLNRANNILFDQIQLAEDDQFTRLDKEKFEIFEDTFELKPHSLGLIQDLGINVGGDEGIDESGPYEIKLKFVEFLLKNQKYQILIDILTKKVWKEDEEVFLMMELERLEEAVWKIFEVEKGQTLFDPRDVDSRELKRYKLFLENILKVYNAIIKRKEEEALKNVRALNTSTLSRLENDILTLFNKHRNKVLKEVEFMQIFNFVVENNVAEIYSKYYDQISKKWQENRVRDNVIFNRNNLDERPYQFFIDLFTEGQIIYPSTIEEILRWIRTNDTIPNKKLIICYIIKKDLANLANDFGTFSGDVQISTDAISIMNKQFSNKFNMSDKEMNLVNGLVRLDLLIQNIDLVKNPDGKQALVRSERLIRVAKEACHFLSSADLVSDTWKEFVIDVFKRYECFDELAIFIRSGNINWDDAKFARDHISTLLKLKKVLQAYYFASAQIEGTNSNQTVTKNFRELFYYYIGEVIKEGLTSQLFNINFKNYEKEILEDYFRDHNKHAKYYILYLLKLNHTTEAVKFFMQNTENPNIDNNTKRFLVWRVGELPELIRTGIFEAHPILQQITKDSRNDQEMAEEPQTSISAQKNQGTSKNSAYLLKFASNKMSQSSTKKERSSTSAYEVQEALVNKEEAEKRLGLFFASQEHIRARRGLDQWNGPQTTNNTLNNTDSRLIVEEEEVKQNAFAQPKSNLERSGFNSTFRSMRNSSVFKQNDSGLQGDHVLQRSNSGTLKKRLSQIF